ncbi:hypothetical protein LF95_10550 [Thalassospira sp. TSL5-1]|nr:hypothetical protein LF95_10550 [Thalassospira sp. TSL5-1]
MAFHLGSPFAIGLCLKSHFKNHLPTPSSRQSAKPDTPPGRLKDKKRNRSVTRKCNGRIYMPVANRAYVGNSGNKKHRLS